MRASNLYAPTLREIPAEAEIVSHQLMLRAGMINKVAAGMYAYLPLAWRTMKKIMDIIREEMDAVGGQELSLPIVQPAEIWQKSGRWSVYGAEMWRIRDRHNREFCLGPTHEEIITMQIKQGIRSYKQLPQRPYQIATKFRDERRPRFGLMRGREFMMKDMYSFDRNEEGLETSYQLLYQAYGNIFSRCGLNFRPVEAASGAIGGSGSHEFMALAESGEAEILFCNQCDYAASVEIASVPVRAEKYSGPLAQVEIVATPNCQTVEEVAAFLGQPTSQVVKSMCYHLEEGLALVLIRGDRQINEEKLSAVLGMGELNFATDEEMRAAGLVPGYIGPVGVKNIKIIADNEVPLVANQITGAGQEGYHKTGINYGRDYQADILTDLRIVEAGEQCPHCSGTLQSARGIEVGQVFKLHTKYSDALGCSYLDENGKEQPMVMGCYGIGVGRTMAAVIEQNNDEYGIIWPVAVAPYEAVIVPVNDKDPVFTEKSEELYQAMLKAKIEVVLDDRKERGGVKFNDADLIGYPFRVTVGNKTKNDGLVEIKIRATGEVIDLPIEEAAAFLKEKIAAAK